MAIDLSRSLVIGISSRALFDLEHENSIFDNEGLVAFRDYQVEHENDILPKGAGFQLVDRILDLNEKIPSKRTTEVVIMSKNSAETSLRIWNTINQYGLDITRGAFSGGAPISPYLDAYEIDLFLSFDSSDVMSAIESNIAAARIFHHPKSQNEELTEIRVAFDGDAVIFSGASEKIFKEQGIDAFLEYEKKNAKKPLPDGPFAKLLRMLHFVQKQYQALGEDPPIRTALVTARNAPSHERVIRTLRAWGVNIDETFFMGGVAKTKVLQAFKPHIFFDDQLVHCQPVADLIPTGNVPTNDY